MTTLPDDVDFSFDFRGTAPRTVQGGQLYSPDKTTLFVESGGRYKLFTERADYVKIVQGKGFFKWARGETPFSEGDAFCMKEVGEYEINGRCHFAVLRK